MKLIKDMTKKERKAYFKTKRVLVKFNTGTRIMKSDKFPNIESARANGRTIEDLLTTDRLVRNDEGKVVGCESFSRM